LRIKQRIILLIFPKSIYHQLYYSSDCLKNYAVKFKKGGNTLKSKSKLLTTALGIIILCLPCILAAAEGDTDGSGKI